MLAKSSGSAASGDIRSSLLRREQIGNLRKSHSNVLKREILSVKPGVPAKTAHHHSEAHQFPSVLKSNHPTYFLLVRVFAPQMKSQFFMSSKNIVNLTIILAYRNRRDRLFIVNMTIIQIFINPFTGPGLPEAFLPRKTEPGKGF